MKYPIAYLSEEAEEKIRNLEQQLGVVLIAYDREDDLPQADYTEENMFMDDNINLI